MELVQLKACQNQIILIALAGAGVMLGLAKDQTNSLLLPFYFLLPLLILLPLWVIYFEKARTISRIIGFIQLQEKLIFSEKFEYGIIGWETAMQKYRDQNDAFENEYTKNQRNRNSQNKSKEEANEIKKKEEKRLSESVYWFTVNGVFLLLSLSCILMSLISLFKENLQINSTSVMIFSPVILIPLSAFSLYLALNENGTRRFRDIVNLCVKIGLTLVLAFFLITFVLFLIAQPTIISYLYWYTWILVLFSISYLSCTGVTMWYLKNLVRGRYTYPEFERRWETIILNN
jgi:hypothetical protein